MDDPEPEAPAGMNGMPMGQGSMQGAMGGHQGMMQMMMHCMSLMERMHAEEGPHDHEGMGMNGMGGMGTPGMMVGDRPPGAFDARTIEALARAFVVGRSGDEVTPVEIVGVTVDDGNVKVEYRQGNAQGTVLVDGVTGEVTEADDS
ncbi:MAG: hypothetical protein WD314_06300 [Trueperaceae bacterium]